MKVIKFVQEVSVPMSRSYVLKRISVLGLVVETNSVIS